MSNTSSGEAEIHAQKTVSCHGSYQEFNSSLDKSGIYQNLNEIISVANGSKSSTALKAYANSSHHMSFSEDCKVGTDSCKPVRACKHATKTFKPWRRWAWNASRKMKHSYSSKAHRIPNHLSSCLSKRSADVIPVYRFLKKSQKHIK